jgi:molecular chaperone DnaK (HSP70)
MFILAPESQNYMLALDFGTTNSVIAHGSGKSVEIVDLPGISDTLPGTDISVIPSLVYVGRQTLIGSAARDQKQQANRLFRNFKRGIVATQSPAPRQIDGQAWSDRDAGEEFLRALFSSLPFRLAETEQLVLTAPVMAFEGYLEWLTGVMNSLVPDSVPIRLVDESTAAALGYAVTEPSAVVLVLDFCGGTLDL